MQTLRIALNLANTELVTGHDSDGSPTGPAPDMARRVTAAVDRQPVWIEYSLPSDIVAAAHNDEWDICFLATDPTRAEVMDFTEPWTRLEVCFAAATTADLDAFDSATGRIACLDGGAYTLWLERHMPSATLIRCGSFAESVSAAIDGRADVVIGIRPFFDNLELVVGGDNVMTVEQAIGVNLATDDEISSQVMSFIRAET
jgi:polar amino acid transport system substrate-binding protein